MTKAFWKSKRMWGLVVMLITAFPDATSPMWGIFLDAGIPGQWVARGQTFVWLAGFVLALYGSIVADKRIGLK